MPEAIFYELIRQPRRRSVAIKVDPEKGVIVTAPSGISVDQIETFVMEKTNWIRRIQKKQAVVAEAKQARTYLGGGEVFFMGTPLELSVQVGRLDIKRQSKMLKVYVSRHSDTVRSDIIKRKVKAFYKAQAEIYFPERVAHWAREMRLQPKMVRTKWLRSRWGSCSADRNLNFNIQLMCTPPSVIDYVVVHELAHLQEMNHSSRFWDIVHTYFPTYKAKRRWLNENGDRVGL